MKRAALLLAAGLIFGSLTACDTPDKGYLEAGIADMGVFDFDGAMANMEICGHKVDLSKGKYNLDSSFSLRNGVENELENGSIFDLMCDGDYIGTIRIECGVNDKPDGKKILFIELIKGTKFKINGISNASTIENVITRFGEPTSSDRFFISYSGKGSQYLEFDRVGTNGTAIQSIEIGF